MLELERLRVILFPIAVPVIIFVPIVILLV